MIQLKPLAYRDFQCPECHATDVHTRQILIEGLHVVADNACNSCGFNFLQLLPVSHAVDFPLAYCKIKNKLYDSDGAWIAKGLYEYFAEVRPDNILFQKTVYKRSRKIVLLNALDFLYGHTLLKLLNAQFHLDHDNSYGLIVIIPKNFEWLVPSGCAEVWTADVSLNQLRYRFKSIHDFISHELMRFDEVHISKAYSHPDFRTINICRFTRVLPFSLGHFLKMPMRVTFVLREDRWWVDSGMWYGMYRTLSKMGFRKTGCRLLVWRQNQLVKNAMKLIRKELPDVQAFIVGIGRAENQTNDKRTYLLTADTEREWCKLYAASHVVIGVHGSNMLLPSAHAAACVEILPEDRLPNLIQDIAVRHTDRRQLFLCRFVEQFASSKTIALHALSILKGYPEFYKNMCRNQYTHVDDED